MSVVLLACSSAGAQKIITFDAPGAGTGSGQGTFSQGISDLGITYGYYIDGNGVAHGFLRFPGGEFATFDAPGAGTAAGQGTFAFSLNPEGALAGYSIDANGVLHGYVRTARGAITTFDAPSAGTSSGEGTLALNINPEGTVAGYDFDANDVAHAFLRHRDGSFTVIDVAGAGTGPAKAPALPAESRSTSRARSREPTLIPQIRFTATFALRTGPSRILTRQAPVSVLAQAPIRTA